MAAIFSIWLLISSVGIWQPPPAISHNSAADSSQVFAIGWNNTAGQRNTRAASWFRHFLPLIEERDNLRPWIEQSRIGTIPDPWVRSRDAVEEPLERPCDFTFEHLHQSKPYIRGMRIIIGKNLLNA